jgi:hypothetical protein
MLYIIHPIELSSYLTLNHNSRSEMSGKDCTMTFGKRRFGKRRTEKLSAQPWAPAVRADGFVW